MILIWAFFLLFSCTSRQLIFTFFLILLLLLIYNCCILFTLNCYNVIICCLISSSKLIWIWISFYLLNWGNAVSFLWFLGNALSASLWFICNHILHMIGVFVIIDSIIWVVHLRRSFSGRIIYFHVDVLSFDRQILFLWGLRYEESFIFVFDFLIIIFLAFGLLNWFWSILSIVNFFWQTMWSTPIYVI